MNSIQNEAIVNTMEVLETKPLNELVSEAIIKVCYVQDEPNPNETVINRTVGKEIASTLPGAPVAGFFNRETGDFEEHSRRVTFENGDLVIEDITKPYGFVSPTDSPWYQDFIEDGVTRTYLMCKAYLWTRQYEEASLALNKGQSMELDERTMSGYYSGNVFIFTSATLDKLCILGDSYAPCFAGANIVANYAKQYESLADQLEKTIGRRYYVMKDQLVPKPEAITLNYALELGWNLTDAIYKQLEARGAENKYYVSGIFAEGAEIFAILQDKETLENVKCTLTITDADTVELAPEMVAVSQSWIPKAPADETKIDPINGGQAVPEEAPATEFTQEAETERVAEEAPATEFTEEAPAAESAPETSAEPETEFTEEATDPAPEATTSEPATEFAEEGGPTSDEAPAVDYAAEHENLTAKVAELTAQIGEFTAKISSLEEEVAAYRKAEGEVLSAQKEEMITSYSSLLDESDIAEIKTKVDEYTLDDLEAKLAVTYARKQRAEKPATNFQVNIAANASEANIPDFLRQAIEFDKARELNITELM